MGPGRIEREIGVSAQEEKETKKEMYRGKIWKNWRNGSSLHGEETTCVTQWNFSQESSLLLHQNAGIFPLILCAIVKFGKKELASFRIPMHPAVARQRQNYLLRVHRNLIVNEHKDRFVAVISARELTESRSITNVAGQSPICDFSCP